MVSALKVCGETAQGGEYERVQGIHDALKSLFVLVLLRRGYKIVSQRNKNGIRR